MHNRLNINTYANAFKDTLTSVITSRITHNLVFVSLITTVVIRLLRVQNNLLRNVGQFLEKGYTNNAAELDVNEALKQIKEDITIRHSFEEEKIAKYRPLIESIKTNESIKKFQEEGKHVNLYEITRLKVCYVMLHKFLNDKRYNETDHLSFLVVVLAIKELQDLKTKIDKDTNVNFFLLVVLIVSAIAYNLIL
ncbi:hypothetical protein N9N03_02635 [Chlamydiia bacterium]|nr:hypothetical protein [Chlamydiia bacterium]